jgi:hypothetical protein
MIEIKPATAVEMKFPLLLSSLPTPKEVQEIADRFCQQYGWRGKNRADAVEGVKLQYYFGGRMIPAVPTKDGLLILDAGLRDPETLEHWMVEYQAKGQEVIFLNPSPWELDGAVVLSSGSSDSE